MQLPNSDNLEIEVQYLNRLFGKTSECYKYFWFQAILTKVLEGKDVITYEELMQNYDFNPITYKVTKKSN